MLHCVIWEKIIWWGNRTLTESYFVSSALRFFKKRCFLERFQSSRVCPPGKSNILTEMSTERWWNDIDRVRPKYSEKIQRQCHFVPLQTLRELTWDRARAYAVRGRVLIA
jgi:hypothetical protein